MKQFEEPAFKDENDTILETDIEQGEQIKKLEALWKKYHFRGVSPSPESPAGQRLIETCARYAKIVFHVNEATQVIPAIASLKMTSGGGEDYMSEMRARDEVQKLRRENKFSRRLSPSDTERRDLHNQIAVMVVEKVRTGMPDSLAHSIADFACELTYGKTMDEFDETHSR